MADLPVIISDTSVAHVTFFEDRAEVTRIARCRVPAGRSRIHAFGLTLLVDDRSLMCKAPRGVDIVFSRIRRRVEDVAQASAEEIGALETELDRMREKIGTLDRSLSSSRSDSERVDKMLELWAAAVRTVPSRTEQAAGELSKAYDALDSALRDGLDDFMKLRAEKEDTEADLARSNMRLDQARTKKPRFEAFAEIELTSSTEAEVELEIVYRTPCALWRPEHRASLSRNGKEAGEGEIAITTFATVWQITGETWTDIACRFSTARPAREANAPALREDVLHTRKKSSEERKQIVVEAREQMIRAAGARGGTHDVSEMPGVEDGGEAQWLTGRSNATIESDGRPVRIPVGERTLRCTVARVAYPELGPATHLRASGTLPGPNPLLAGPVTVGRESEIVGHSQTKFVGAGEPFELGFGVDDGLRVRRKQTEKRKVTQVTGTQHIAREVTLYVSNLSGDARPLSIIERVPVSEVEDVQIEIDRTTPIPGVKMNVDRDGFVTLDLEVAPRATRDLVLRYRVEAKSNVVLPT